MTHHIESVTNLAGWFDNIEDTNVSSNLVFHARTKHIEVNFHFVRGRVSQKQLYIWFGSSKDEVRHIFAKPLPETVEIEGR